MKLYKKTLLGFLALFAINLQADEFRLLMPVYTDYITENNIQINEESYKNTTLGIGYEYNTYNPRKKYYNVSSLTVHKNAYNSNTYTLVTGLEKRIDNIFSIGTEAGLIYEKEESFDGNRYYESENADYKVKFRTKLMGKIYIKDFSINLEYEPNSLLNINSEDKLLFSLSYFL
jgi:hypothetical protein